MFTGKEHDHKMIFGWEDDNGIGEMLLQQILRKKKRQRVHLKRNIQKQN